MSLALPPGLSLRPNETYTELWDERSNFAGTMLETTGYGCHLVLFIMCAHLLITRPNGGKISWWSLAYITTMFVVNTVANALNLKFNQMVFIDDRAGPGGPLFFLETNFDDVYSVGSFALSFINTWLQDGLLLYRFFIFFGSNPWVLIAPGIMYLASISMACVLLFQLSQPFANIWTTNSVNFAIPTWSISIGLNVILTISICIKLLIQRRRARNTLGPSHGSAYFSIAAMIVESALLYTAVALVFIITFGMNSFVQNLAIGLLAPAQCIAPLLIIYRVAQGRAWNKDIGRNRSGGANSATRFNTSNTAASYGNSHKMTELSMSQDATATGSMQDYEAKAVNYFTHDV